VLDWISINEPFKKFLLHFEAGTVRISERALIPVMPMDLRKINEDTTLKDIVKKKKVKPEDEEPVAVPNKVS